MDTRGEKTKELVALQQQLQNNAEQGEFIKRQLQELAAGHSKTERDAVIVVDKQNAPAGKVRLNYLVDSASWRPQYKFHAGKAEKDPVQVEYLAAVMQQTGEEWTNVQLDLSTAEPLLNAAPPELTTLDVTLMPQSAPAQAGAQQPPGARFTINNPGRSELDVQSKGLRQKAQQDYTANKGESGQRLINRAAAVEQTNDIFNGVPAATNLSGVSSLLAATSPAIREGQSVTYHLNAKLTVPSRNDEQILEVGKIDMVPNYFYKAVPVLTTHVYRLANLTNKSKYVLLPGEATMYLGTDFVGRMDLPLVAIGEQFTAGFGVDPQLQVQRQMIDKSRTMQGGNQILKYQYRILVSSYKSEEVKLQLWDRLPLAETEAVGVNLVKSTPEISTEAMYLREQRPRNLLRWDLKVDPAMTGEKALAVNYEFKLELDRQMTFGTPGCPSQRRPGSPDAMRLAAGAAWSGQGTLPGKQTGKGIRVFETG